MALIEGSYLSSSSENTKTLGKKFSSLLQGSEILALFGDLGAGKTTFVKGLVEGLGGDANSVQSPTFVYLNCFEELNKPIYHFDLYRLAGHEAFLEKGFDEFLSKNGLCVIEWPERILPILPEGSIGVYFEHQANNKRLIHWKKIDGIHS